MSEYWADGLGRYVLRHPSSIAPLLLAGWRIRRNGWWRHAPYLPVPDSNYWKFRMNTVLGSAPTRLSAQAVVDAAKWSMVQRRER